MSTGLETKASIRLFGDDLDPDEVSRLLGCAPDHSRRRGALVPRGRSGPLVVSPWGSWIIETSWQSGQQLDEQMVARLARTTGDLAIWRGLAAEFDLSAYCGFARGGSGVGFELAPGTLAALRERRIRFSLEIYE